MAKDRFLAQGVTATKRQRSGKPVGSGSARKQPGGPSAKSKKRTSTLANDEASGESDDQIGNVDDLEHRHEPDEDEISSEDEFLETAAEKRLRLAKDYITKIKESTELEADEYDAEQIDRDLIAERLMTDARERTGKWSRQIADGFSYVVDETKHLRILKNGHRLPVTCVALTPDCKYIYSGSKDGSLIKWQRDTCRPIKVFPGQKKKNANHNRGHCDHILCVAVSSDGRYVATGGRDRRIHIWSVSDDQHLAVFHQHKDSVTGLVFRRGTNHLYSCSADRMVKLWNIDELGYMDTLFGHQDSIVSIDALQRERAVTTGGRDKTVRLWKIADEAQLVFRAGSTTDQHRIAKSLSDERDTGVKSGRSESASQSTKQHKDLLRKLAAADVELSETTVDVIAMVDEETYVTGGDSGILSLWSISKKKPVFNYHVAHGIYPLSASQQQTQDEKADGEDDFANAKNLVRPHWITALAAVPLTDLFFSASSDGFIRMWQMRPGKTPGFDLVNAIPVQGYVNGLSVRELAPNGDSLATKKDIVLAAAIGQEHRLGRWEKVKARNVIKIFHLPVLRKTSNKA